MKLGKYLLPLALFAAVPMCACTPTNQTQDKEEEKHEDLSFDEIKSKLESLFDITFEYDEEYSDYYAEKEVSSVKEKNVQDAVDKINFLTLDGEIIEGDDDGVYYEACMVNSSETISLYIDNFEYEGDYYLTFVLSEILVAKSWSEIPFNEYFAYDGEIPGPSGCSEFEYIIEDEYAQILAYGGSASSYASTLEDAGFYVEPAEYEGVTYYSAYNDGDSISFTFYEDSDFGALFIIVMGEYEE